MARPTGVKTKSIPVRFAPEDLENIKLAASMMKRSEQEIIRLCVDIGLVRLRRIKYKVAELIDDAAASVEQTGPPNVESGEPCFPPPPSQPVPAGIVLSSDAPHGASTRTHSLNEEPVAPKGKKLEEGSGPKLSRTRAVMREIAQKSKSKKHE